MLGIETKTMLQGFEEITKELETLKERIKYFDGEGCINATPFDDSTWSFPHNGLDHRKHAFVPAVSLKIAHRGLPEGKAQWYECGHGERDTGELKVNKNVLDDIAPYISGFKRPLLYLALSENINVPFP